MLRVILRSGFLIYKEIKVHFLSSKVSVETKMFIDKIKFRLTCHALQFTRTAAI